MILSIHNLAKRYGNLTALNDVSFSIEAGSVFGILGPNGSGKTTTFRLLTGDLNITSGNAYLGSDADLLKNKTNFYSRIGYCPQNDALLDRLTGMQTLLFFGRIRGLETSASNEFIKNIVEKFKLKQIINKLFSVHLYRIICIFDFDISIF